MAGDIGSRSGKHVGAECRVCERDRHLGSKRRHGLSLCLAGGRYTFGRLVSMWSPQNPDNWDHTLTFENCHFGNLDTRLFEANGLAMKVTFESCDFANVGREGFVIWRTDSTGIDVNNCTFTGFHGEDYPFVLMEDIGKSDDQLLGCQITDISGSLFEARNGVSGGTITWKTACSRISARASISEFQLDHRQLQRVYVLFRGERRRGVSVVSAGMGELDGPPVYVLRLSLHGAWQHAGRRGRRSVWDDHTLSGNVDVSYSALVTTGDYAMGTGTDVPAGSGVSLNLTYCLGADPDYVSVLVPYSDTSFEVRNVAYGTAASNAGPLSGYADYNPGSVPDVRELEAEDDPATRTVLTKVVDPIASGGTGSSRSTRWATGSTFLVWPMARA